MEEVTFRQDAIRAIFKKAFYDPTTKVTHEGLKCSCELLRLIVVEALQRASKESEDRCMLAEDRVVIEPEDVERILFQLVLDIG
jgi:hypothetical protein|mmetsp:Transcript_4199/g.7756  ORF Transcript_4199/g.7756 Transcript_4199/m.7756 type:complete len:84 (+) Transcript_4199:144-395(+)